jgi:hypothetical protein
MTCEEALTMKSDQDAERIATPSDYLRYFEISGARPGTEKWRDAINLLISDISEDLESSTLPEKDVSRLVESLLSAREARV